MRGPSDCSAAERELFGAFVSRLNRCSFNTVNRLASAFDYGWKTDSDRVKLAAGLNRIRYRVPGFLLR